MLADVVFLFKASDPGPDPSVSDAVYVFSPKWPAPEGALLEVTGKVLDYVKQEHGKPVTQIKLENVRVLEKAWTGNRTV